MSSIKPTPPPPPPPRAEAPELRARRRLRGDNDGLASDGADGYGWGRVWRCSLPTRGRRQPSHAVDKRNEPEWFLGYLKGCYP